MWTTVRCGRCRGCGEAAPPTDASAEREDVCLGCGGDAYIVPVTVKATGSTKSGRPPHREPMTADDVAEARSTASHGLEVRLAELHGQHDDEAFAERRQVARELQTIRATDPQLAAALESFHGPEGDAWVEHRWGRGFVVWQHTAAAQLLCAMLAEQSSGRAGYLVAPTRLLALARETQEHDRATTKQDAVIRILLGRAEREARELLARMQRVVTEHQAA